MLLGYKWELTKSPAGAHIWHAVDQKQEDLAPDVEDSSIKVPTMMTTADIALSQTVIIKKSLRIFTKTLINFQMLLRGLGLNYYIEIWGLK